MHVDEINYLIRQGEGLKIEFKEAKDSVPHSFYDTAVSFANTDGFNPFPKNPNIRKFFTAFGWTDEIGSGIRNSNKYLPLYADGARPVFYENDTFVTEIPLQHLTLAKFDTEFIAWLGLGKEAEMHLRAGLPNIALPPILLDGTWEDVLLHLVPSWHQNGTQLAQLSWPDNQAFEVSKIKTVPSWSENGTQLLRKKAWYLIAILSLCTASVRFVQLLDFIGYKNEKSFREKYIKPLRDVGYIKMTNPENTTDPENKYEITDEGKAFLGGLL
jgi:ATP-dependent DNA helicase RecG